MNQRVCQLAYQMAVRHASNDVNIRFKLDILVSVDGHYDCVIGFYRKGLIVSGSQEIIRGVCSTIAKYSPLGFRL